MPVLGPLSYTLEVPSLDDGIRFYTDAGLEAESDGKVARFRCTGQERDSIILISGASKKRLHHVALRANGLDKIAADTATAGGSVITARSEEHTSELQSLMRISYAVFCLKKQKKTK